MTGLDGDTPVLRPPARQATVKNLITHTAGFGYWFWSERLVRWEKITGAPNVVAGSRASFTAPMLADPGEAFIYGINIDWLGKVVEAVTGVGLDVAIKQGITGPDWWAGGHGLYGPPSDYIKFERALLRGGELDGTRILRPETVDAAFTNQIGDLDFPAELPTADPASSCTFRAGPGYKWGYGLLLNTAGIPGMRRAGSGAWAGLCNTQFWIDRTAGVCGSIYSNFLPFVTPEAVRLYNDFERALYASL